MLVVCGVLLAVVCCDASSFNCNVSYEREVELLMFYYETKRNSATRLIAKIAYYSQVKVFCT